MQPSMSYCCPACASIVRIVDPSFKNKDYIVNECPICELTFSSPMKAADSAWYAGSWLYDLRIADGAWEETARTPWNFSQALSCIRRSDNAALLDIGCAEGQFLNLARKAGCEVTGLDFNPHSLEVARKVFNIYSVYQCSAEEFYERYPDLRFDVVTLFEVLEHTADPFEIVCSIRRLLKPGGKFLLSVPGNRRWPQLFHPEVDTPPHHLTLWTQEALTRILERAGYRVLNIRSKPLGVDDLGIHLKWRLHKVARTLRPPKPSNPVNGAEATSGAAHSSRKRSLLKNAARTALAPVSLGLRLHPRAGGFTLFAECQVL